MTVPGTTTIGPPNGQNDAPIFVQTAEIINATAPTTDLIAGTMSEASNVGTRNMTETTNATTDLIAEMNHETASSTLSVYFASGHTPQANAPRNTSSATNAAKRDTLGDPRTAETIALIGMNAGTVPGNINPTGDNPTHLHLPATHVTKTNQRNLTTRQDLNGEQFTM